MASLNKVMVIGNLGADPEMRFTPSGAPVTTFRIACSHNYSNKDGEKKQETEWFAIVAWGKQGELCNQYLTKGRKCYVEGRLKTRTWTNKEGIKRYATEVIANQVIFLDRMEAKEEPDEVGELKPEELPF